MGIPVGVAASAGLGVAVAVTTAVGVAVGAGSRPQPAKKSAKITVRRETHDRCTNLLGEKCSANIPLNRTLFSRLVLRAWRFPQLPPAANSEASALHAIRFSKFGLLCSRPFQGFLGSPMMGSRGGSLSGLGSHCQRRGPLSLCWREEALRARGPQILQCGAHALTTLLDSLQGTPETWAGLRRRLIQGVLEQALSCLLLRHGLLQVLQEA